MSALQVVPASALRTQAWANGAGTTTVIASGPDDANWQWRLSIAEITQDCTFSSYPDTRRQLVALDAPLHLRFDDERDVSLLRLSATHFDGADAPHASLPDGPTRAFNLMLRGASEGELFARPLNGSMWLPRREHLRWFVHLLGGRAKCKQVKNASTWTSDQACGSMHSLTNACASKAVASWCWSNSPPRSELIDIPPEARDREPQSELLRPVQTSVPYASSRSQVLPAG